MRDPVARIGHAEEFFRQSGCDDQTGEIVLTTHRNWMMYRCRHLKPSMN
jgi:hypothetical protein